MKLLRSFPALCFGLVLLSIVGLCTAQRSVELLLVAGTLAAMSWYVTEGPRGRVLPRWVSNILVIGVCLNVVIDVYHNADDPMSVLGRFAVWLTLIKLYERRTARDHAHLLMLSLLLMMTGCLQSSDLLFGIILLLYAGLGLYVLLLYQVHAAFEQSREARQAAVPAGYRPVPVSRPVVGRNAALHFRIMAGAVGLSGIGLSLFIFVLFPRDVGANLLGTLSPAPVSRQAQFAWNVQLGAGGRITESRIRAFTLQLANSQGRPIRREEPLLLRGAVLDRYDGNGRWSASPAQMQRIQATAAGFTPLVGVAVQQDNIIEQRFVFARAYAGERPVLSVYAPIAVSTDSTVELLYEARGQTLKTPEDARRLVRYTVRAQESPTDAVLQQLTERVQPRIARIEWLDDDSLRIVREHAESALRAAGVPLKAADGAERWEWNRRAAQAFVRYLQSSEFTYTTDLSDIVIRNQRGESADPIARFLQIKRGHCEYFASAMAAMCHVMLIPSRLAIGYIAYEYDDTAEQYNVLERHAHAWVEVATGEYRWTAFDPTPPASMVASRDAQSTLGDQVRWVYQGVEANWSSNIIGFDGAAQMQLADSIAGGWAERLDVMFNDVRAWMERVNQAFYFGPAGYIWMGIVAFALVIAIIALVKLMRRSLAIRRTLQLQHLRGAEYQRMLRQLGFYLDMLAVLRRAGLAKPDWQPPMEYARRLATANPAVAEAVSEITSTFYAARYGRQKLTRAELNRVRMLLGNMASSLGVRL